MVLSVACYSRVPENALKLLKFMSVFLTRCDQHPGMLQIVDIFLDDAQAYLISDQFIYFVYHIYKKPGCATLAQKCVRIFSAGLVSGVPSVSKAAHATFCQIPFGQNDVPISDLLAAMNAGRFPVEGVEVLARAPALPASRSLVATLLRIVSQSSLVVICLTKLSRDQKGAELLLRNAEWMKTMGVSDAFVVLLAICIHSPLKEQVIQRADAHRLLARVGREGNVEELDVLVRLIRRFSVTEALIRALDAVGFFEQFLPRALWSDNVQLKEAAILLMDKLGRPANGQTVWVDGFKFFIQALPAIIQVGGVTAQNGLVAALVLSFHLRARQHFAAIAGELTRLLAACQVEPSHAKYKDTLLGYLKTCESK
jgi:hypothetical protein